MAKGNQGILGNLSGSIGNVVASSWKGTGVYKSKPSSVANPQTAAQVAQRSKMTATVAFAKAILSIWIKPLFDRFAQKMTGYNLWVQKNIDFFADPEDVQYDELIMSVGNMAATDIASVVAGATDTEVVVTWVPDTQGFHLATDVAYLLVFNTTRNEFGSSSGALRSAGTTFAVMPFEVSEGDSLIVWLAFKRSNGVYVSLANETEHIVA